MAPIAVPPQFERDNNDNNGNNSGFEGGSGFGDGSGFGSGSGFGGGSGKGNNGSNSQKSPSFPSVSPFKVITRKVTVTATNVRVKTSVIVFSSSSTSDTSSSSTISSTSVTSAAIVSAPPTSSPTSFASSTDIPTPSTTSQSITSSTTSSFSAPTSQSSSADLNRPGTGTDDGSSQASTTALGTKSPLPVASIISIILGCLFFITLCLVIYVRRPKLPKRVSGFFRRRRNTSTARTISSFEPREFRPRHYPQFSSFGPSARSLTVISEFSSRQTETSRIPPYASPTASRGLLLDAAPPGVLSSPSRQLDSGPDASRRKTSSSVATQMREAPRSRTISVFDNYPFEHDVTDPRPILDDVDRVNVNTVVHRSSGFPQSVHEMTVE